MEVAAMQGSCLDAIHHPEKGKTLYAQQPMIIPITQHHSKEMALRYTEH
jgi:hypothetical protein